MGQRPGARTKFPPVQQASHVYRAAHEVTELTSVCGSQGDVVLILAYPGCASAERDRPENDFDPKLEA